MSFILDALRKSESERHQDARPSITRIPETIPARGLPPWALGTIAALALGVVVLAGAFWWMSQSSRESVITEMLAAAETNAVSTLAGQLGSLTLPDSSTARLGAESRLAIVPEFGRKYRTVRLTGAGSFTVAPGNEVPFDVRAGDALAVTVGSAGGTISVSDYADDPHAIVRADAGEARVRAGEGARTLASGAAILIARDGTLREPTADELAQAFAWTDGRFVARDMRVADIAARLWRWYGTRVSVPDSAVAARTLSMDVPLESSQAALNAIEEGANARFAWEGGKMVFRDRQP